VRSLRVLVEGQGSVGLPLALRAVEVGHDVTGLDVDVHELYRVAARVPLSAELLEGCDAVVLVTDHDDVDYDLVTRHAAYIFDTRNRLRGAHVELL
jgi:UDP-N-acetyl-D-glucosamine dehydrogenase